MTEDKRICIIGAGPAGMASLFHFAKLDNMPDVICFEKQSTWGGLWNTSWRTGVDEYGERNHASMYKQMWTNGFKEIVELPDYTYEEHFGKSTPCFAPRAVIRDYIEGRWTRKANRDLKTFIEFNTAVRWVKYHDDKQNYTVFVDNLKTKETREEIFSHVIVATGIYSTPFVPEIDGMNDFGGRVIHSHDLRNAAEFNGQNVLLIGASYSGEDIALQLIKFKANCIYLSYKDRPKSATCIMPKEIDEKPLVVKMGAKKAFFTDGTEAEVDSVILCTGYKNYFPFLESRFRIVEHPHFYPPGLYKGTLFHKAGNNNLFYMGAELQFFTFKYFDALASWMCRYIMGNLPGEPKSPEEMENDSKSWVVRAEAITSETEGVQFIVDLMDTLVGISGYDQPLTKAQSLATEWIRIRKESHGILNFRDYVVASVYTGKMALKHKPFMQNFDDSMDAFLNTEESQ